MGEGVSRVTAGDGTATECLSSRRGDKKPPWCAIRTLLRGLARCLAGVEGMEGQFGVEEWKAGDGSMSLSLSAHTTAIEGALTEETLDEELFSTDEAVETDTEPVRGRDDNKSDKRARSMSVRVD